MPDDIVISVNQVSKAYRIWSDPAARLQAPLLEGALGIIPDGARLRARLAAKAHSLYRDFFALRDVTFEVRKGEGVGIVGRNGSGKSTLLQIIAGTLQPTAGSVQVSGRVAALLELGSGFNPDFTGRENVYLNAAILGLSRAETDARYDSIAAFADIGDFLDQPVKTYSSGMMMRLAFAVQTAVEPDILIVDEALSVGDAPFQAKCFARIRTLQESGCSTLFVSHDIGTVRAFCTQAVWLRNGLVAAQGTSNTVCGAYQNDCLRAMGMNLAEGAPEPTVPAPTSTDKVPVVVTTDAALAESRTEFEATAETYRKGDRHVQIANFFLQDAQGARSTVLRWDEEVTAVFVLQSNAGYEGHFYVAINVRTIQGVQLLTCADRTHGKQLQIPPGGHAVVRLRTRLPLRAGKYIIYAGLHTFADDARFEFGTYDFTRSTAADLVGHAAYIEIAPQFNLGIYGPVQMDSALTVSTSHPAGTSPTEA